MPTITDKPISGRNIGTRVADMPVMTSHLKRGFSLDTEILSKKRNSAKVKPAKDVSIPDMAFPTIYGFSK